MREVDWLGSRLVGILQQQLWCVPRIFVGQWSALGCEMSGTVPYGHTTLLITQCLTYSICIPLRTEQCMASLKYVDTNLVAVAVVVVVAVVSVMLLTWGGMPIEGH